MTIDENDTFEDLFIFAEEVEITPEEREVRQAQRDREVESVIMPVRRVHEMSGEEKEARDQGWLEGRNMAKEHRGENWYLGYREHCAYILGVLIAKTNAPGSGELS